MCWGRINALGDCKGQKGHTENMAAQVSVMKSVFQQSCGAHLLGLRLLSYLGAVPKPLRHAWDGCVPQVWFILPVSLQLSG